jgi:hypothetical protein
MEITAWLGYRTTLRAPTSNPIAIHPSPNTAPESHATSARRSTRSSRLALCAVCLANLAAAAPHADGWRSLLTDKVVACGVAAVALLVLSLLLRGLLKVITLALVVVLAAGVFWFLRDAWNGRADLLPHQWTKLADGTLDSQKARDAWQSVESELSHLSADARSRFAAGTDDARRILVAKLEAKAQKLRKEGSTAEADQLARLADLVRQQK